MVKKLSSKYDIYTKPKVKVISEDDKYKHESDELNCGILYDKEDPSEPSGDKK